MAEYIECRSCDSPDCKGCNLKNLETMLKSGKFDCLMNGNRCINPAADVVEVGNCDGCIWAHRKRPQKCSCCRRNPYLKDCYEEG